MAGALFNRLHVWAFEEVLKSSDLNAEFDNIINNMTPALISSFSQTIAQSQIQLNPGSLGNQNLATSLADEIAQLRFEIARIIGSTFSFDTPALSIAAINALLQLGVGIPPNRIISGREVGGNNHQPMFLLADGAVPRVTLKAGGGNPNFVFEVKNSAYTVSADIILNGLTVAPNANNTATVADPLIINDKYAGEKNADIKKIKLSGVGSEISARVGQYAAFKHTNGSDEYFIAYVQDTTTLVNAYRGYFFDPSGAPITRVALNNGDTITLMRMTWIFAQTSQTSIDITYTNPVESVVTPPAPAIGDYWFDMNVNFWKKFNGTSFMDANAELIGVVIQDTTKAVATRSYEFFALYNAMNEIEVTKDTSAQIRSKVNASKISVAGTTLDYGTQIVRWNTATTLDAGTSLTATTRYWLYITDIGDVFISNEKPYDRNADLFGFYHPYKPWRCVGETITDGASLLLAAGDFGISKYRIIALNTSGGAIPAGPYFHIPLDTTICDPENMLENPGASGFIRIQSSGMYNILGQMNMGGGSSNMSLYVFVNGNVNGAIYSNRDSESSNVISGSFLFKCGDSVVYSISTSGAGRTVDASIVSPPTQTTSISFNKVDNV